MSFVMHDPPMPYMSHQTQLAAAADEVGSFLASHDVLSVTTFWVPSISHLNASGRGLPSGAGAGAGGAGATGGLVGLDVTGVTGTGGVGTGGTGLLCAAPQSWSQNWPSVCFWLSEAQRPCPRYPLTPSHQTQPAVASQVGRSLMDGCCEVKSPVHDSWLVQSWRERGLLCPSSPSGDRDTAEDDAEAAKSWADDDLPTTASSRDAVDDVAAVMIFIVFVFECCWTSTISVVFFFVSSSRARAFLATSAGWAGGRRRSAAIEDACRACMYSRSPPPLFGLGRSPYSQQACR